MTTTPAPTAAAAPEAAPAPADAPAARATTTPAAIRAAAVVAGASVVAMAPLGIFGNVVVQSLLGDTTEIAAAIRADAPLVSLAATAFVVVAILDVIAAWALAQFFADQPARARLAGWLRTAYAAGLLIAAGLLTTATTLAGDPAADDGTVAVGVVAFGAVWQIALVMFATHLAVLAGLVVRHAAAPTLVGWIIAVAAAAYAFDSLARLFLPHDSAVLTVSVIVVSAASVTGELAIAIWLLARGGRARDR